MKPQKKSPKNLHKSKPSANPEWQEVRLIENITMQKYNVQNPPFTVSHVYSLIFMSFSEEVTYLRPVRDLLRMPK